MPPDVATMDLPARKLRVPDLQHLIKEGDHWRYQHNDQTFSVSVVWLQGEIVSLSPDGTIVDIEDDTHVASITDCSGVPGGTHWVEKGQYVMAVGLLSSLQPQPTISAMKLANLSSQDALQHMWPEEVKEVKAVIAKM